MRSFPIALLLVSAPANAANWVHFADCGSTGQVRTYWYDSTSLKKKDADRTVRIRGDYSKVSGSPVAEARILWTVDCGARTFSEQRRTEHRADGHVLVKYNKPTDILPVQDGSVAMKLLDAICT